MKCKICDGLGIRPGLTKNTKCSYCDWGEAEDDSEMKIFGWAWFEMFMDEVVNDGISYGPRKPDLKSSVEGVSFIYLELYAKKEDLEHIEWRWV